MSTAHGFKVPTEPASPSAECCRLAVDSRRFIVLRSGQLSLRYGSLTLPSWYNVIFYSSVS